jgi:hypothetical protein
VAESMLVYSRNRRRFYAQCRRAVAVGAWAPPSGRPFHHRVAVIARVTPNGHSDDGVVRDVRTEC